MTSCPSLLAGASDSKNPDPYYYPITASKQNKQSNIDRTWQIKATISYETTKWPLWNGKVIDSPGSSSSSRIIYYQKS